VMDADALALIVRRLRSDKVGQTDQIRIQQNMHRAAEALTELSGALQKVANVEADLRAQLDSLKADLDAANARITALTNSTAVKRTK
jgi:hypothetical protein